MTDMPQISGWPENRSLLHVARISPRCVVLGPGVRAVLWVQGCPFRCAECLVPEMLPFAGGDAIPVERLVEQFIGLSDVEGCTLSGGEPMAQAAALVELIDAVRQRRDLTFMAFTGYTLHQLQMHGTRSQRALLDRLDLLVDGPYLPHRHTDLRWRGSDNQQLHFLTDRYRHLPSVVHEHGSWLEFELLDDGTIRWTGIPPRGFRENLPRELEKIGILLMQGDER